MSTYISNNSSCHTQQFSSSFCSSNKLTAHFLFMTQPQALGTTLFNGCPGWGSKHPVQVSHILPSLPLLGTSRKCNSRCPKSKDVCCIDSCSCRLYDYSKSSAPFACVCEESQGFDQDPDVMIDPTFSNTRTFKKRRRYYRSRQLRAVHVTVYYIIIHGFVISYRSTV